MRHFHVKGFGGCAAALAANCWSSLRNIMARLGICRAASQTAKTGDWPLSRLSEETRKWRIGGVTHPLVRVQSHASIALHQSSGGG